MADDLGSHGVLPGAHEAAKDSNPAQVAESHGNATHVAPQVADQPADKLFAPDNDLFPAFEPPSVAEDDGAAKATTTEAGDFEAELKVAESEIAGFVLRNQVNTDNAARLADIKAAAKLELGALRKRVEAASGGTPKMLHATSRQAWRIVGHYEEVAERLDRCPFVVSAKQKGEIFEDININVRDAPIPPWAGKLKAEIDEADNVIVAVFNERLRYVPWLPWRRQSLQTRVKEAQSFYIEQLFGIAQVGLATTEPSRIEFAQIDLVRLRKLFTLREAGVVKNTYVKRLAFWSLVAAVIFGALYGAASVLGGPGTASCTVLCGVRGLMYNFRNFDLLAVGTAIGTWLSFSLRRQNLDFADLAALEPDRLDPAERIAFMIGLSGLVGLLLFSGAIIAGIGTVTGMDAMHRNGSSALLLGLLAGVAERALGTAVSKQGLDFATIVGGGATVPDTVMPGRK